MLEFTHAYVVNNMAASVSTKDTAVTGMALANGGSSQIVNLNDEEMEVEHNESKSGTNLSMKQSLLPNGPSTLCFVTDDFVNEEFDVDGFITSCRSSVSPEVLRNDLKTYLDILKSSMIELINKDYADFVNLSTNLVSTFNEFTM